MSPETKWEATIYAKKLCNLNFRRSFYCPSSESPVWLCIPWSLVVCGLMGEQRVLQIFYLLGFLILMSSEMQLELRNSHYLVFRMKYPSKVELWLKWISVRSGLPGYWDIEPDCWLPARAVNKFSQNVCNILWRNLLETCDKKIVASVVYQHAAEIWSWSIFALERKGVQLCHGILWKFSRNVFDSSNARRGGKSDTENKWKHLKLFYFQSESLPIDYMNVCQLFP